MAKVSLWQRVFGNTVPREVPGRINAPRVVIGGIVAGVVSRGLQHLVDDVFLGRQWDAQLVSLGRGYFGLFSGIGDIVFGLIGGILSIWLYASICPRFGAGRRTAILAGMVVWAIGTLVPNAFIMFLGNLFSRPLAEGTTLGAMGAVVIGTLAGAELYRDRTLPATWATIARKARGIEPARTSGGRDEVQN